MRKRYLLAGLIILSIASIFIGVKDISPLDILNLGEQELQVMVLSRIPRLISIIVAGFGMSISGLIMQQITQNRFVSPTTAATIDSAKLGILVSLILFSASSTLIKMIVSFIFALMGSFLFMAVLKRVKYKSPIIIPLLGIMVGNIINSITTFFAYRYDLVQNISAWMQGISPWLLREGMSSYILVFP